MTFQNRKVRVIRHPPGNHDCGLEALVAVEPFFDSRARCNLQEGLP